MLFVPWKRTVFGPPFLFQISNDVQPRRRGRDRIGPTFLINTDITGSELKWVMARLLMATHFIRAFYPGERFS